MGSFTLKGKEKVVSVFEVVSLARAGAAAAAPVAAQEASDR
jgi:hypothetical protein